jgi:hypothetical protein
VSKEAEKLKPSCTVDGNVNGTIFIENSMEGPQKIEDRIIIGRNNSTSAYIPPRI